MGVNVYSLVECEDLYICIYIIYICIVYYIFRMFTSVDMNKNYLYIYIFMGVLCQRDNVRTLTPSGRYPNDNIPTLFN